MAACVRVSSNTARTGKFWKSVLRGGYVRRFISKYYVDALMHPAMKALVIVLWLGALGGSVYGATRLRLGLDEQLVLPSNSYLIPYFNDQQSLGEAGPPVYIVLQDVDYLNKEVRGRHAVVVAAVAAGTNRCRATCRPLPDASGCEWHDPGSV